jgi:alpha/beta superfamily hydrolase
MRVMGSRWGEKEGTMRRLVLLIAVLTLFIAGASAAAAGNAPSGEISIQEITFENEGDTVYGTFTTPSGVRGKMPAVLMLHGFTGDRNEGPVLQPDFSFTDFMYERTARVFAENGVATLRIDFRGSGESVELIGFEETTFSGQVSDAYAAVEWLDDNRKVGDIGVLGLSQGGLVGTITAEAHKRVSSLVLWSPVANPVDTYRTVLGNEWIGGDLANPVFGGDAVWAGLNQPSTDMILPWGAPVTLNQAFFEELYTTDPIAAISHYDKPMQVVVGERDDIVTPQPQYGETYMTYHDGVEELVILDGDHVFDVFTGNGAPALDEAIDESLDWFIDTLRHRRW